MLCTLSGVVFVKHSAPGILSVCLFFFWWHSEGSQSPGDESGDGGTEGFHSETPRRPLGAETRGAHVGGSAWVWEMWCGEGQRSTERRMESTGGAVVCPATCFLDSEGLRKPLLLCWVPQRKAAGPGALCHSYRQTRTGLGQRFLGGKCKRRVNCQQWWRCWALVPAGWGL